MPTLYMLADDSLVQYVVLRRDLWVELGWPLGSIVAQACHAATAALWLSREQPEAAAYCAPEKLDYMHKVRPGALHVTELLYCVCRFGPAKQPQPLWSAASSPRLLLIAHQRGSTTWSRCCLTPFL